MSMDLKWSSVSQRLKQGHIAAPLVAKKQICADAKCMDFPRTWRFLNESFAGFLAESVIKGIQERSVPSDSIARNFASGENFAAARDPRDNRVGSDGQSSTSATAHAAARVGHVCRDDLLMTEMHTVKHANRQADLRLRWQVRGRRG